jgi:hypothetical protein
MHRFRSPHVVESLPVRMPRVGVRWSEPLTESVPKSSVTRILGLLLAAGFLYRILFLDGRQLWTDELMQAFVIGGDASSNIWNRIREGSMFGAPLDYLVQEGFSFILGNSAWALRFHAVVFGTLSLWIFYRIAKRLSGARVALYATFLLVFYPLHYHYSQEGRPFALFILLTLFSYDLLLGIIAQRRNRPLSWIMLFFVLVLLLYTQFLAILVLASQLVGLATSALLKYPPAEKPRESDGDEAFQEIGPASWASVGIYLMVACAACAAFTPWASFIWDSSPSIHASESGIFTSVLRFLKELGDQSYLMTGLLLLGVATGLRAMLLHRRRQSLVWLLSWAGTFMLGILIVAKAAVYFYAIRYTLGAAIPLVLMSGYGLSYVGEQMRILERSPLRLSSPAIVYACALAIGSIVIARSHWYSEPVDWKGASAYLQETLRPDDRLALFKSRSLLGYYAPTLAGAHFIDFDSVHIQAEGGVTGRTIVGCCDQAFPDRCADFRDAIAGDAAWKTKRLRGFTFFTREGAP